MCMTTRRRYSMNYLIVWAGLPTIRARDDQLALLWQIFAADERDGIPKSVFQ